MAKGRRKSLTKNQLKWNKLVTSIKRLGYESLIPEKPSRITAKTIQKLEEAQAQAKAGQKARKAAVSRVKYWQKKGYYVDASILPERGASANEYEAFTAERIKQEAATKDWTDGERIQPYEDRYNSTVAILEQIDEAGTNRAGRKIFVFSGEALIEFCHTEKHIASHSVISLHHLLVFFTFYQWMSLKHVESHFPCLVITLAPEIETSEIPLYHVVRKEVILILNVIF